MKSPSCPPAFLDVLLLLIGSILVLEPEFERRPEQLELSLPEANDAHALLQLDEDDLLVGIDARGIWHLDSEPVAREELVQRASRALTKGRSQAIVHGDRRATLEAALQILEALQEAGFRSIRFAIAPGSRSAGPEATGR